MISQFSHPTFTFDLKVCFLCNCPTLIILVGGTAWYDVSKNIVPFSQCKSAHIEGHHCYLRIIMGGIKDGVKPFLRVPQHLLFGVRGWVVLVTEMLWVSFSGAVKLKRASSQFRRWCPGGGSPERPRLPRVPRSLRGARGGMLGRGEKVDHQSALSLPLLSFPSSTRATAL